MKKTFFLVGILLLIIVVLLIIALSNSTRQPSNLPFVTPTPAQTVSQTTKTVDFTDTKRLLKIIQDKQNGNSRLSAGDELVKERLTAQAASGSGTLVATQDYTVNYVKSFDMLEAEIDTPNISVTKKEVVSWLSAQGMSPEGMCSFLYFMLPSSISSQLPKSSTFTLLPEGC